MYPKSMRSISVASTLLAVALVLAFSRVGIAQLPHFHVDQRGPENADVWFEKATDLAGVKPSSHWMGVAVRPIDPLLQKHLRIEGGLIVQQVTEDGPAAQAGVQIDDILLSVNDAEVAEFKGLMEFLTKNKGQEITVKLLREGKQQTLKVTPVERPEGHIHVFPPSDLRPWDLRNKTPEEIRKWVEEMAEKGQLEGWKPADGNPLRMRFFHPGVVLGEGNRVNGEGERLPDDLKIIVGKQGNEPASVTVVQGERSWSVSVEELDKLPADVQGHVKKYLSKYPHVGMRVEPPRVLRVRPLPDGGPAVAKQLNQINARLERIEHVLEKLSEK